MSDVELTERDNGQSRTIRLGESVSIRLPEIGGTAFLWHVIDADGFEVVEDRVDLDVIAPGAASVRHLVLKPNRVGEVVLTLCRHRPWESAAEADAEITLFLDVEEVDDGETA